MAGAARAARRFGLFYGCRSMKNFFAISFLLLIINQTAHAVTINSTAQRLSNAKVDTPTATFVGYSTGAGVASALLPGAVDVALSAAEFGPISAAIVGLSMAYLAVKDDNNSVTVMGGANQPSTSIPPSSTPATSPPTTQCFVNNTTTTTDCSTACQQSYPNDNNRNGPLYADSTNSCHYHNGDRIGGSVAGAGTSTCPPNTTYNSSLDICQSPAYNFTNNDGPVLKPSQYTSNGNGTTSFVPFGGSPVSPSLPSSVDPIQRTGVDENGNLVNETIAPNTQSGIDYTRQVQTTNSVTNAPQVNEFKLSTDQAGTVTAANTTVYNNSTLTTINNNKTTTQSLDTSSLNQEATQQKILTQLSPTTMPSVTDVDTDIQQDYNDTKTKIVTDSGLTTAPTPELQPLTYWTYASGTCYPAQFSFAISGHTISFDLTNFCMMYDTHIKPVFVFLLGVLGMLHAIAYWREQINLMIKQ